MSKFKLFQSVYKKNSVSIGQTILNFSDKVRNVRSGHGFTKIQL